MASIARLLLSQSISRLQKPLPVALRPCATFSAPISVISGRRSFQTTRTSQSLDALMTSTHTLLDAIHSTSHLPWSLSIPLTALALRVFVLLPVGIYTHRVRQRQAELAPLLSSWHRYYHSAFLDEGRKLLRGRDSTNRPPSPSLLKTLERKARQVSMKKYNKKQTEVLRRWGGEMWKVWLPPLFQIPIWLVLSETLRKMCGMHTGLLGMVMRSGPPEAAAAAEQTNDAGDGLVGETAGANMVDSISQLHSSIGIESTMATEGMLWFPSLLDPDPQLLLPFLFSACLFLNLRQMQSSRRRTNFRLLTPTESGMTASERAQLGLDKPVVQPETFFQLTLRRTLQILALSAGPILLNAPAGMIVFWIASNFFGLLQAMALEFFMPMPRNPQPAKRQVKL